MEIVDSIGGSAVPTVLIFEDLQWADDLSLETLTELPRQTRDQPSVPRRCLSQQRGIQRTRAPRMAIPSRHPADRGRGTAGWLDRDETALMTTLILGTACRRRVTSSTRSTPGPTASRSTSRSSSARSVGTGSRQRSRADAAVPETLEDATLTADRPAVARGAGRRPRWSGPRPVVRLDRPRRDHEPPRRFARRSDPGARRP